MNNFREIYYLNKCKEKFRAILWVNIRLPKIIIKYHPNYLINNLSDDSYDDSNLEKLLNDW